MSPKCKISSVSKVIDFIGWGAVGPLFGVAAVGGCARGPGCVERGGGGGGGYFFRTWSMAVAPFFGVVVVGAGGGARGPGCVEGGGPGAGI